MLIVFIDFYYLLDFKSKQIFEFYKYKVSMISNLVDTMSKVCIHSKIPSLSLNKLSVTFNHLCVFRIFRKTSQDTYNPPVMNFSAKNTKLLLSVRQYIDCINRSDYPPFKKAMWHQMLFLIESKFCYIILKFLLHTVPAYLIDSLLIMSARKAR